MTNWTGYSACHVAHPRLSVGHSDILRRRAASVADARGRAESDSGCQECAMLEGSTRSTALCSATVQRSTVIQQSTASVALRCRTWIRSHWIINTITSVITLPDTGPHRHARRDVSVSWPAAGEPPPIRSVSRAPWRASRTGRKARHGTQRFLGSSEFCGAWWSGGWCWFLQQCRR